MGILTDWAWAQDPDGVLNKLVLVYLCDNLERGLHVTLDDICERCEASRPQVGLVLDDLSKVGLIDFDPGPRPTTVITIKFNFNIALHW